MPTTPVREIMAEIVETLSVGDTLAVARMRMERGRIRHLPILEDDELVGLISIGDLVKAHHHQVTVENHYLKSYIQS